MHPRALPFLAILLLAALLGCRTRSEPAAAPGQPVGTLTPPGTRAEILAGKVVQVNPVGQFVLVAFPPGRLPAIGQTMGVFRAGQKVGEVRISAPQQEDLTVADIVSGQVERGDRVSSGPGPANGPQPGGSP